MAPGRPFTTARLFPRGSALTEIDPGREALCPQWHSWSYKCDPGVRRSYKARVHGVRFPQAPGRRRAQGAPILTAFEASDFTGRDTGLPRTAPGPSGHPESLTVHATGAAVSFPESYTVQLPRVDVGKLRHQ